MRKAEVRRAYPNSLRVLLHEHVAQAYWGAASGAAMVNTLGEVFEANLGELEREGLPRLDGPEGSAPQVLAMFYALEPLFQALDLSVDALSLRDRGSWLLVLSNEAQLELGSGTPEQVLQRTQRWLRTVRTVLERYQRTANAIEYADLRYTDGYALRLRGVNTISPAAAKALAQRQQQQQQQIVQKIDLQRADTEMAREYKDVVVGLDIGTSKVMAVVAEVLPNGDLKLAGLGVASSNGLKRGVVVNIEATVQSIQQALKEAELMADCKIQRVHTGITGSHIRGLNQSGVVAIKDKEVTPTDVARVIETAKAVSISSDQRLLLVEPQEFVIDGQDVKEPIGMSGIRLEAKVAHRHRGPKCGGKHH